MASVSSTLAVFLAAIPKIIGFAVILVIGWMLASLLARGIATMLRNVRFNELSSRSGFSEFVKSMGVETDASGFIALIAKWFVRLLDLVVAFALGLPALSVLRKEGQTTVTQATAVVLESDGSFSAITKGGDLLQLAGS